jgi:hypothetical protein
MNWRRACVWMGWAAVASAAGCWRLPGGDQTSPFLDGFEGGLTEWTAGADVPQDPNNPGHAVVWSIQASEDQAHSGECSARLRLDGSQDDGTIWLQRTLEAPGGQAVNVNISLWVWSATESFNTLAHVAAYSGPASPTREADFDVSQAADRVAGWKLYTYQFETTVSRAGQVFVALGISVVWETVVTYYFDDVQIEIVPR